MKIVPKDVKYYYKQNARSFLTNVSNNFQLSELLSFQCLAPYPR